jgi:hypothetical protein
MPGSVRAAQIVIWATGGLALLIMIMAGVVSGPYALGQIIGANLLVWPLFVMAFFYGRTGHPMRVTSIVFASLNIVFGLGAISSGLRGEGGGGGGFAFLGGIVVVILLSQGSAGQWFRRPRGAWQAQGQGPGQGLGPGGPYGP